MSEKIKIAHILFSLTVGGTETMLIDIINQQVSFARIGLFIINDQIDESLKKKINNKVKLFCIDRKPGSFNPLYFLKINFLLARFSPDVIHCHNHNVIRSLIKPFQRQAVLTIHDTGISSKNFKKYRKLFAISNSVAGDVKRRSGLESTVIQNGIEIDSIAFKTNFKKSAIFRIVQVSRLQHEKKGQHILIEALKVLRERNINNVRIDFIGDGPSKPFLIALANKYNLSEDVQFLGLKDRSYIYKHLQEYSLLVQPSFYEGFGLTVVEALAANLPVLVTSIDGPKEILLSVDAGYMFEVGNFIDCANKIEYVMSLQVQENLNLRQKVRELYSISTTAQNYIRSYDF